VKPKLAALAGPVIASAPSDTLAQSEMTMDGRIGIVVAGMADIPCVRCVKSPGPLLPVPEAH
jgi:hypothetical protein